MLFLSLQNDERRKYNKFLESLHDEASYAETMRIEAEEAAANAARKVEDEFRQMKGEKRKTKQPKIDKIGLLRRLNFGYNRFVDRGN